MFALTTGVLLCLFLATLCIKMERPLQVKSNVTTRDKKIACISFRQRNMTPGSSPSSAQCWVYLRSCPSRMPLTSSLNILLAAIHNFIYHSPTLRMPGCPQQMACMTNRVDFRSLLRLGIPGLFHGSSRLCDVREETHSSLCCHVVYAYWGKFSSQRSRKYRSSSPRRLLYEFGMSERVCNTGF
ncbi:hypothetical protein V8F33_001025 [Rhypophila sp. PSN 637]